MKLLQFYPTYFDCLICGKSLDPKEGPAGILEVYCNNHKIIYSYRSFHEKTMIVLSTNEIRFKFWQEIGDKDIYHLNIFVGYEYNNYYLSFKDSDDFYKLVIDTFNFKGWQLKISNLIDKMQISNDKYF